MNIPGFSASRILAVHRALDKIQVRTNRRFQPHEMRFLQQHSHSAGQRRGKPIRGSDKWNSLTLVAPEWPTLLMLSKYLGLLINMVEVAFDIVVESEEDAIVLFRFFKQHFVFVRSPVVKGKVYFDKATYAKQRGRGINCVIYCDRSSKFVGTGYCLHFEIRFSGSPAVEAINVLTIVDLMNLDFLKLRRRYIRLLEFDKSRFGRWHHNRTRNERRQKPNISEGRIKLNRDVFTCAHIVRLSKLNRSEKPTTQELYDHFGRGPYFNCSVITRLHQKC